MFYSLLNIFAVIYSFIIALLPYDAYIKIILLIDILIYLVVIPLYFYEWKPMILKLEKANISESVIPLLKIIGFLTLLTSIFSIIGVFLLGFIEVLSLLLYAFMLIFIFLIIYVMLIYIYHYVSTLTETTIPFIPYMDILLYLVIIIILASILIFKNYRPNFLVRIAEKITDPYTDLEKRINSIIEKQIKIFLSKVKVIKEKRLETRIKDMIIILSLFPALYNLMLVSIITNLSERMILMLITMLGITTDKNTAININQYLISMLSVIFLILGIGILYKSSQIFSYNKNINPKNTQEINGGAKQRGRAAR